MDIGFDYISDLNLKAGDDFNWESKATSLYCIVAGNISNDLSVLTSTLKHLCRQYKGVFFTPGMLEYEGVADVEKRTDDLNEIIASIKRCVSLHSRVAVVDGVAVLGVNGWYGYDANKTPLTYSEVEDRRHEDLGYIKNSLDKLQRHLDVRNIILVSSSVPGIDWYFGEEPDDVENQLSLDMLLKYDTESKISHWVYGTYGKVVDVYKNDINYLNNARNGTTPYWPKRIAISN